MTFDYADMSSDALRGPPIAAMAFAGIMLLHAMYKVAGRTRRFEVGNFGEAWERYVSRLIDHPELGLVRARIFEKMKHKNCEIYKDNRRPSLGGSRAWEWRDDLMM
ncbi:hypothetical protein ACGC1H_004141 [Rhizoctonia solani]|uniref:Uncharacterized protein n=1 Tax=Rhizoctonia solani TaxID=456999 RepID=A0A8H3B9V7_9AGAM|nr:unnamed protein product [Rhizoctonia solani]